MCHFHLHLDEKVSKLERMLRRKTDLDHSSIKNAPWCFHWHGCSWRNIYAHIWDFTETRRCFLVLQITLKVLRQLFVSQLLGKEKWKQSRFSKQRDILNLTPNLISYLFYWEHLHCDPSPSSQLNNPTSSIDRSHFRIWSNEACAQVPL